MTDIDRLRRASFPRVKYLKTKGAMVLLCGVSDGRGRICGCSIDGRTVEAMDLAAGVMATCSKHASS